MGTECYNEWHKAFEKLNLSLNDSLEILSRVAKQAGYKRLLLMIDAPDMKRKAKELISGCRTFYGVLPQVKADFKLLKQHGVNKAFMKKWFVKVKKIIQKFVTPQVLSRLMNSISISK